MRWLDGPPRPDPPLEAGRGLGSNVGFTRVSRFVRAGHDAVMIAITKV